MKGLIQVPGTTVILNVRKRSDNSSYRYTRKGDEWSQRDIESLDSVEFIYADNMKQIDKDRVNTKWSHKLKETV